jgi:uncharacterized protein YjbI with pentapeptide repeats
MTDLHSLDARGDARPPKDTALVDEQAFTSVELPGLHLAHRELYRCTFTDVKIPQAMFERCVFESCRFVRCDLTRSSWKMSSLRGVRFEGCKLLGVDLGAVQANPEVEFDACNLELVSFDNLHLRGVVFRNCALQGATFEATNLVEADFAGSDLGNVLFRRADLTGADLSTAERAVFLPSETRCKDARISTETAVGIAQALGLRVAGHDDGKKSGKGRRK